MSHAMPKSEGRQITNASELRRDAGIRLLCVDDHPMIVEGLKAHFAIEGTMEVIGVLSSANGLMQEVTRLKPDMVLLDIEMPGADVFDMVERLKRSLPQVRVIFLSAHVRDGYLAAAYKCHADGYFSKSDELEDIVRGIREVAHHRQGDGAFVMSPKVQERCMGGPRQASSTDHAKPPNTPMTALSGREIEVLRLIGKGLSRNEIATELFRSAKTIDGHQERIMRKLKIGARADLIRFAIREGLVEA